MSIGKISGPSSIPSCLKLFMCNPSRPKQPTIWTGHEHCSEIEDDIHLEIISLTIYSIEWNLCIVHPILLLVVILWYLILNHQYSNVESSKHSIFRIYSNLWTVRLYPTSDQSKSMYILMLNNVECNKWVILVS